MQNDSLNQQVIRLETLVEQEKRLNSNLSVEIESLRKESTQMKESSLLTNNDQMKQVIGKSNSGFHLHTSRIIFHTIFTYYWN